MLAIAIKDSEMQMGNSSLLLEKSTIKFELWFQKGATDKQMASALYYKY